MGCKEQAQWLIRNGRAEGAEGTRRIHPEGTRLRATDGLPKATGPEGEQWLTFTERMHMMTNQELREAIDRTRDYTRNSLPTEPIKPILEKHLEGLLAAQLERAKAKATGSEAA
jgi:hypothetical protein